MSEALKPVIVKHMAAITDPDEFAALLQSIGEYKGSILTKTALLLLAMTFQRPANVRGMRWQDLDLQAGMWNIPSALMKRTVQQKVSGKPHLVPLCREAVALLREVEPLTKPHGDWVFPSLQGRGKCMSENTLNHALRRLGIQHHAMVSHGFRASARTLLVERLGVDENVVEAQLAHAKRGPLGSAYDRTQFIDARVMLMHQWGRVVSDCARGADFPDELPAVDVGVKVAPRRQSSKRTQ
jgi:integrase